MPVTTLYSPLTSRTYMSCTGLCCGDIVNLPWAVDRRPFHRVDHQVSLRDVTLGRIQTDRQQLRRVVALDSVDVRIRLPRDRELVAKNAVAWRLQTVAVV